jgi:RNA polymerase sigma-70 factor (ECF subfamily)
MIQQQTTIDTARETLLTRLVHDHARLLYRVAFAVLRNPADAEDAVQDALFKLFRSHSLPDLRDERAFLARAVYRTALDRIGARAPATQTSDPVVTGQLADGRPDPETLAASADLAQLLALWIDELQPELRETLLLSAIDGLNSREAGEILGIPEATVRTRLHRARGILRERAAQIQPAVQPSRGRPEVAAIAHGDPR